MLVIERMTAQPVIVTGDMTVRSALETIQVRQVHHLPVVDNDDNLVGIVAEKDLLRARDDDLLQDIMTRDVVTVTEYTALEEAARIMADNKITCLPVLRGNDVVGIITETDLFRLFLELFGARQKGVRLSAEVSSEPGTLAKISEAIFELGGDIIAIGSFAGDAVSSNEITMKVQGVDENQLKEAIQPLIIRLTSICTMC